MRYRKIREQETVARRIAERERKKASGWHWSPEQSRHVEPLTPRIDSHELALGIEHELEHTTDPRVARKIAEDHLREVPDYYSRLHACMPKDNPVRFRKSSDRVIMDEEPLWEKDVNAIARMMSGVLARDLTDEDVDTLIFWAGELSDDEALYVLGEALSPEVAGEMVDNSSSPQQALADWIENAAITAGEEWRMDRWKRNPPATSIGERPASKRVERLYLKFHGAEPSEAFFMERAWIPGKMKCLGLCVDVGYDIIDRDSNKDGRYVHDHHDGVKVYKRMEGGGRADLEYRNFPTELMVLGNNLGFTYEDADGVMHEVPGSKSKKICTNSSGDKLIIVDSKGVLFLIKGGKMRVKDWIYY